MKKIKFVFIPSIALVIAACGGNQTIEDLNQDLNNQLTELEENVAEIDLNVDERFTSTDGKYKINFPGTPNHTEQMQPTAVGNIEVNMDMYEKSATEIYMVAYNDYPSAMIKESNPDELIEGAIGGSKSALGATEEDERTTGSINGFPMVNFKAKNPANGYHVDYKVILRDNRLYQVAILRDGNYPSKEARDKFFDTFELTDLETEN